MTKEDFTNRYFKWLYFKAFGNDRNYKRLFNAINDTIFNNTYLHPYDRNRIGDGVSLRYHFCAENGLPYSVADEYFDPDHCSVLEMMLALAEKAEDMFISNPDYSVQKIFFDMLTSLGISSMVDWSFNDTFVRKRIEKFLRKEYLPNGSGGLFTIPNAPEDLRNVELWYQMCWYTNTIN